MAAEKSGSLVRYEAAAKAYRDEKNKYEANVRNWEKLLKSLTKEHEKAVAEQVKAKADLEQQYAAPMAVLGESQLFIEQLVTSGHPMMLEPGMTAEVNTSGNLYTTTSTKGSNGISVGGAALGAMIAGPLGAVAGGKKSKVDTTSTVHDGRNLFITFRNSSESRTIQANPDNEGEARGFADAVLTASMNIENNKKVREEALARARDLIDYARQSTGAIDDTRASLTEAQKDTEAMNLAKTALEQAESLVPKDELDGYKKGQRNKKLLIGGGMALVIIVAIVLAIVL